MDISFCRQCDYVKKIKGTYECVLAFKKVEDVEDCPVEPGHQEFSIYWSDLTPATQKRFRKVMGREYVEDGQFDTFPMATFTIEDEDY